MATPLLEAGDVDDDVVSRGARRYYTPLNDLPLDDATRSALEALSRRTRRTPEQIVADYVRDAVRDTEELLASIERAQQQIDDGEGMTVDEWREHLRLRKSRT